MKRHRHDMVWLLLAASFVSACLGRSVAPEVASTEAEDAGRATCPQTAEGIQNAILRPRCSQPGCHGASDRAAGLDLASGDLLSRLVNIPALGCFGNTLVIGGAAEQSLLFRKVADADPECGVSMPIEKALPMAEIECLRVWIDGLTPDKGGDGGTAVDGDAVPMTCSAHQTLCAGTCVDLTSHNDNCGWCGQTCSGGGLCQDGTCRCGADLQFCASGCVDVKTSNENCGECGKSCPAGTLCLGGSCQCQAGLTACGDSCLDTTSDFNNCGTCGQKCRTGQICSQSKCVSGKCPDGTTNCDGSCVDTLTNALHCGGCNLGCKGGQVCTNGACSCSEGQTLCDGVCVDWTSDSNNCGGCGAACPPGSACTNGVCGCQNPFVLCADRCVDTTGDSDHCGGCEKACGADQSCISSACVTSCQPGFDACGGSVCLDLQNDPENCGSCGHSCADRESCQSGACVGCGAAVSFSGQIQPIFTNSCTRNCHGGSRPSAGLDLSEGRAYGALVNAAATGCKDGRLRVKQGDVSGSYLINKLTGQGMCAGTLMPSRGMSLPAAELAAIQSWICQGAPDN